MKKILFALAAVLFCMLFLGCVSQNTTQNLGASVNNSIPNKGTNISQNIVAPAQPAVFVVLYNDGKFSKSTYGFNDNSNPFADGYGGDLGKGSVIYVRLDSSNLSGLSSTCSNEKQSLFINPMIKQKPDGAPNGVIFDAAYAADFNGTCGTVTLLKKDYSVMQIVPPANSSGPKLVRGGSIMLTDATGSKFTLTDGSSFKNDDRFKVMLAWKDGQISKIVIYMNGYFDDIKDNDYIQLFGSNTVNVQFRDLVASPKFLVSVE